MRFLKFVKVGLSLALAPFLVTPLVGAAPNPISIVTAEESGVNWYAPGRVSDLLRDLQSVNARLASQGERFDNFSRSAHYDWRSDANTLNNVRDHINEAGNILNELQSIRYGALPWQKQAIDRIHPVALDLAGHTEAAIAYLNQNQHHLFAAEYRDHLAAISDRTDEMKTAVGKFLAYGEAQQKIETLGQSLEIAGS